MDAWGCLVRLVGCLELVGTASNDSGLDAGTRLVPSDLGNHQIKGIKNRLHESRIGSMNNPSPARRSADLQ